MRYFSKKIINRKFLSVSLTIVLTSFFFLIFTTHSCHATSVAEFFITKTISYGSYIIDPLLNILIKICEVGIKISGGIFDYVISYPFHYTDVNVVVYGWQLCRDLANMFLVAILVIIAFATILRIETYGMKNLLPKLIVIALLINFSLVIGGLIIDASHVFMFTFSKNLTSKGEGYLTDYILKQAKVGGLFSKNIEDTYKLNDEDADNKRVIATAGKFFSLLFLIIAFFVFLYLALILVIRTIVLWMLLIFAPLAWVASIIPAGQKIARQWWQTFINQAFLAPIVVFMVYLSAYLASNIGAVFTNQGTATNIIGVSTTFKKFETILSFCLVIGFLYGAVIIGKSMNNKASNVIVATAKRWAKSGTSFFAWRPTKGIAKEIGRKTKQTAVTVGAKGGEKPSYAQRLTDRLAKSRIPGARFLSKPVTRLIESELQNINKIRDKYKSWSSPSLAREAATAFGDKRLALVQELTERGDIDTYLSLVGEKGIKKDFKMAFRRNLHKALVKALPHLAKTINIETEEAITAIRPQDIEKVSNQAWWKNEESKDIREDVLKVSTRIFRPAHLAQIAKNRSALNAFEEYLRSLGNTYEERIGKIREINSALADYLENTAGTERWNLR